MIPGVEQAEREYEKQEQREDDFAFAVLRLLPAWLSGHFREGYWRLRLNQRDAFERDTIDVIINSAAIVPDYAAGGPLALLGPRAECPLCGGESQSPYDRGFKVPEGLRRHLSGSYNAYPCRVWRVVLLVYHREWDRAYRFGGP